MELRKPLKELEEKSEEQRGEIQARKSSK